ncbi:XRN 5'-3' exonuclease N-terminus-domain-containing protein [Syncephalis fuscata]|nr:XRN 5'-3' exonuclease N-terminus-domain-containing protein [Syncephalis fuscata]
MGIPKFFRWISERYPLCSQLITENRIPEFDNLYLDMNGIIHNCSHPNDGDAHFRITEDKMFLDMFNYIEHLFSKIKPKKVFFLAIDGVAPRAKMNQQRSRRFRTAKEAQELVRQAEQRGETLPKDKAFDSNCITPGTPFMARLSKQLHYFISKKISEDANWRNVQVILSGHEVPGEGEHKIMEYIRLSKAQPEYDPNVRHCLYGLDADLIMLGLVTHEPHFALLREEVKFGRQSSKRGTVETQNFFLMHLSLLREYLEHEFQELREILPFPYDFERIIDDYVMMAMFIGNDFLPHLPCLHINEGALALMFSAYKRVLPQLDGYLNDGGIIDFKKAEVLIRELDVTEDQAFEQECIDDQFVKGKRANRKQKRNKKAQEVESFDETPLPKIITETQFGLISSMEEFINAARTDNDTRKLHLTSDMPARDQAFVYIMCDRLGLICDEQRDEVLENNDSDAIKSTSDSGKDDATAVENNDDSEEEDDSNGLSDLEASYHLCVQWEENKTEAQYQQILQQFKSLTVLGPEDLDVEKAEKDQLIQQRAEWTRRYYEEKMELDRNDPDQLKDIVFHYIEGLQWVMHYYYNGVVSWGWFYPYHYAPRTTDLVDLDRFEFKFEQGIPFRPFEQLMGVLPVASKEHIPTVYQDLMYSVDSPIVDFYPLDFTQDLNGKKAEWEAVVRIPFIDQDRLLSAMHEREHLLSDDEKRRNSTNHSYSFVYDVDMDEHYISSIPGTFPDIFHCHCRAQPYQLPVLSTDMNFVKGLCKGVRLGIKAMAGFPSLYTIPHVAALKLHGVTVFQQESRNETMVVTLANPYEHTDIKTWAETNLGKIIYADWPFLSEVMVSAVSDATHRYELDGQVLRGTQHSIRDSSDWKKTVDRLVRRNNKQLGVIVGDVKALVHVRPLKGLMRLNNGAMVKEFDDKNKERDYILQTMVEHVEFTDPRFQERPPLSIEEEFPIDSQIFFLGNQFYGSPGQVLEHNGDLLSVKLIIKAEAPQGPTEYGRILAVQAERNMQFVPSYVAAKRAHISPLLLSKITSTLMVAIGSNEEQRVNLGLSIKFSAKNQKVHGYSRKGVRGWDFSEKAIQLIEEYKTLFPDFFAGLERDVNGDIYQARKLFTPETAAQRVEEIKAWLKTLDCRNQERVSIDAEILGRETVELIEAATDKAIQASPGYRSLTIQNIPRFALLKPSFAAARLSNQQFQLGDRVVFVQDSGNVPIAAQGTVVGKQSTQLDVVFDQTFMSGTTLGDRCSPYRGMKVSQLSVLNLSDPIALEPASEPAANANHNANVLNDNQVKPTRPSPQASRGHHHHHHTRGGGGNRGNGASRPNSQPVPASTTNQAKSNHSTPRGRGGARGNSRGTPRGGNRGRGANRGGNTS